MAAESLSLAKYSVNVSVKRLGIPADSWGRGLPFLDNILAPTVPHGWGDNNNSNQNWPVILGGTYRNIAVT